MYDNFFERKLRIYLAKAEGADITNDSALDSHERLNESFLEDFEKCALVVILPPSMLKSLHNKNIEDEIQQFLGKVRAVKDKRHIVMNVVEGKAQFINSSFAKYRASR